MFRAFRAARLASRQSVRSYSTEAHASPIKSDLPYIVASIAVFGPAIFYLTSPPSPAAHGHAVPHSTGKEQHAAPTHKEPEPEVEEPEVAEPEVAEPEPEAKEVEAPVGKAEKKEIEKAEVGEPDVAQEARAEGASEAKASAKSKQPEGQGDSQKVKDDKAFYPEEGKGEGGSEITE